MQISPLLFRIIQTFVLLLILVIVGSVFFFFTHQDGTSTVKDKSVEAVTLRLQKSAESYYSKLRFYNGVCADIGVPTNFSCRETESTFIIFTQLSDQSIYCVDSTGFIGKTGSIASSAFACQ